MSKIHKDTLMEYIQEIKTGSEEKKRWVIDNGNFYKVQIVTGLYIVCNNFLSYNYQDFIWKVKL